MPHASFRTTLLLTVLLIAGALGAAAASGWIMLQDFARASREAGSGALNLTSAMQQIDERSLDMARSARQYAVLRDDGLRLRYDEAQTQALASLATMTATLPQIAPHADTWRRTEAQLRAVFDLPAEAAVDDALPDLATINDRLAAGVREAIDGRNAALLDTLESSRDTLATQVLAAIALALLLAVATGWWILRPLKRVEQAIARLGEGQFSTPVQVGGPADLRRLGEKLEWLRLRLADLETHRNRVLRHVSHELKTPLASIRLSVDAMSAPHQDEADQRRRGRILSLIHI